MVQLILADKLGGVRGALTPAQAFGREFVTKILGVTKIYETRKQGTNLTPV